MGQVEIERTIDAIYNQEIFNRLWVGFVHHIFITSIEEEVVCDRL